MRLVVAGMLLIAVSAFGQAPGSAKDLQQQLLDIEKKIAVANNECDYDYFRRIEAKEFIFTDSAGQVSTRDEDLAGEKDCKKTDYKHEFDEPRLLRYPEVVVFNARHTISGQRNGKDFRASIRFTDVFVWREGRWQLVAGHSSRIPAQP
jgi:hypothetical protein